MPRFCPACPYCVPLDPAVDVVRTWLGPVTCCPACGWIDSDLDEHQAPQASAPQLEIEAVA
jgi:hypothetical protein